MNTSIIYYTSNYLDDKKPRFLDATRTQLVRAIGNKPLIVVSQKPVHAFNNGYFRNICLGDIGRSHLNLYKQILIGCKEAKTQYVALAEDDVLYSPDYFDYIPSPGKFAYNMAKWSIYTWVQPAMYAFKYRQVINSLVVERDVIISALEERFNKYANPQDFPLKFWADFGRLENHLGVRVQPTEEFYSDAPNIVFSHDNAFGYLLMGKRKKLDKVRAFDIPYWGKASDIIKLYE
jgi:hypothetical protein